MALGAFVSTSMTGNDFAGLVCGVYGGNSIDHAERGKA